MHKSIFYLFTFFSLLINIKSYSQSYENPLLESAMEDDDSSLNILLYEIILDDITIPISLSYNSKGIQISELPDVVGLGWKLNDIGKITRKLNHLPDECSYNFPDMSGVFPNFNDPYTNGEKGGWFSSLYNNFENHISTISASYSDIVRFNQIDHAPDYYSLNVANGLNSIFTYKKTISGNTITLDPFILNRNKHIDITTYFSEFHFGQDNFSDIVFEITDESNLKYDFIGGPSKSTVSRQGVNPFYFYKDFYVKNIKSSTNNDFINFSYIKNGKNRPRRFQEGFRIGTTGGYKIYSNDYFFLDESTLVIEEIETQKEKIIFTYDSILCNNEIGATYVKQLQSIKVYNKFNEIKKIYNFNYTYFPDNRFILGSIHDVDPMSGSGQYNFKILKEFEYYTGHPNSAFSLNLDTFEYSKYPTSVVHALPDQAGNCTTGVTTFHPATDRSPDLEIIKRGMLKKIINHLGGSVEFHYQLNKDAINYGGGLIISKTIEDSNNGDPVITEFEYENLKGLVIKTSNYLANFLSYFNSNNSKLSMYPNFYSDTDELYSNVYINSDNQEFGNFFEKVTSKKFIGEELHFGNIRKIYLVNEKEYDYSFEGIYRKPLLIKNEVFKDIYTIQNQLINRIPIKEDIYIYERNLTDQFEACKIESYNHQNYCYPHPDWQEPITITGISTNVKNFYFFQEFLREKITIDYFYNGSIGEITDRVTKQTYLYIGDDSQPFVFDKLRPKEITTDIKSTPIHKKKFKYLFEVYNMPNSGLSYMINFSTENKTRLVESSNWFLDASEGLWKLKESNFYTYLGDGKIKQTAKTEKTEDNSYYTESSYNPHYIGGNLQGVYLTNKIEHNYDVKGKLDYLLNLDNQKYIKFWRGYDKDTYSVNTVFQGVDYQQNHTFYRNSFERPTDSSQTLLTPNAMSGNKVFNGAFFVLPDIVPEGHLVSFWFFKNNKWQFQSFVHSGGNIVINKPSGALYIDEVWIRPQNTSVSGMTFEPLIGITSEIDDRGNVIKSVFDEFGREIKNLDKNNTLLKAIEYNYINE